MVLLGVNALRLNYFKGTDKPRILPDNANSTTTDEKKAMDNVLLPEITNMEVSTVGTDPPACSKSIGLPAALVNKMGDPDPAALTPAQGSGKPTLQETSTARTSTYTIKPRFSHVS